MKKLLVASVLLTTALVGSVSAPVQAVPESGIAQKVAARADTWVPPRGPVFNSPTGSRAARLAILKRVHDAIRHTPRGEFIRFSTYSIDRGDTVQLLGQAHARGVNVQIVVNDNLVSDVEKRLQRRLGKNPNRASFLVICRAACRNPSKAGNQHMKTYSFTRSGAATGVVINSSANLSGGAVNGQWNDAYTVWGNPDLYNSWLRIFNEQKFDRAVRNRRISYRSDSISVHYQRVKAGTARESVSARRRSGDAPLDRLNLVRCRAASGFGTGGRTTIRIAMYAWYGVRGERIARAVAQRQREGCRVAVIGSVMSSKVVRILRGYKVPVKAADWDFGQKLATSGKGMVYGPRCYSHLKFITINGTYDGRGTAVTFTGSENWSAPSLSSDEVTYEIHDRKVAAAYTTKWKRMWGSRNATHPVLLEPKRRPCAS